VPQTEQKIQHHRVAGDVASAQFPLGLNKDGATASGLQKAGWH
jgi:hypothetical protein